MARPRNHAKHLSIAVHALVDSLTGLARMVSSAAVRRTAAWVAPKAAAPAAAKGARGPGKNNPKLKAALKASWARMSAADRKARIERMLAGRGLKAKKRK